MQGEKWISEDVYIESCYTSFLTGVHVLLLLNKERTLGLSYVIRLTFYYVYKRKQSKARTCLLYTSPSPRDRQKSRMPSSA